MKKVLLAGLVLVAGVGVAGCGGAAGAAPASGEPELGATPAVTSYADVELPLDRYRTRPEESLTLNRANDLVLRDCLARFGFAHPVPERVLVPDVDRPIGVVSADDAAAFGYRSPFAADVAAVDKAKAAEQLPSKEAIGVVSGTGKRTVNGVTVPEGGCSGEARKALGNWQPGGENLVVRLAADSYAMAEADSRVRAAFTRWSQCMSAAGFDYREPMAANDDPVFATETPTPEEIATATADVACRAAENVNGVWVAAITAYQVRLVGEYQDALNRHRAEVDTQVATAKGLLGE